MRLLGAVFLCTGLVNLVQGKVVTSFEDCNQFFVAGQPPTFKGTYFSDILKRARFICQTQNPDSTAKDYEYVTLYLPKMKIPLYSAYKFRTRTEDISRDNTWKIEPELDGSILPSMTPIRYSKILVKNRGENQAVNKDYEGSGFNKGHLYPVNHAHDQKAVDGTFTLTNAAPQNCDFNKRWYDEVESEVFSKLKDCPPDNAYVVTGVIPSDKYMKGYVNVPSHFWTAYCCKGKSGSFIMSATDLKASENPKDLTLFGIEPFGGKC